MNLRTLTDEQVIQARQMCRDGATIREVGLKFGISVGLAHFMLIGKVYADIPGALARSEMRPMHLHADKSCGASGEKNASATISDLTASYIKAHLKENVSSTLLAKYFKTSRDVVRNIKRGLNWQHIKPHPKPPEVDWLAVRLRGLTFDEQKDAQKPIRLRGERLKEKLEEAKAGLRA